jgi:hypothetical protein
MGDRRLVVGLDESHGVSVFDVKAIVSGTNVSMGYMVGLCQLRVLTTLSWALLSQLSPLHTFSEITAPLLNLLPNPSLVGGLPNLVLCLGRDSLQLLNIADGEYGVALSMTEQFTCGKPRHTTEADHAIANRSLHAQPLGPRKASNS